jgi:hypothetical protein
VDLLISGTDSASLTRAFETTMSELDIWPALSLAWHLAQRIPVFASKAHIGILRGKT